MRTAHPTQIPKSPRNKLAQEVEDLRIRLAEAEDALQAIRSGDVDAIVVSGDAGEQVFTLKGADQPYRILVETMSEGTVTLLPDGTIAYCNSRFAQMVRTPLEQVIGSPFARFLSPPSQPLFKSLLEGRVAGGRAEFTLRCQAGRGPNVPARAGLKPASAGSRDSDVPVQISSRPFGTKDGGGYCLMIADLTETRRAQEALQRSSAYNRTLIEASLDPLVTIAPDGKITDVNTATEKVTGRSRQELIGTDFCDYFTDPARARAGYQQVLHQGSVLDYELGLRHRDGHVTPVLYNASVYRGESGEVVGVFAAARDITEHKRAEESRARLAAIVESSDDAIIAKSLNGAIQTWNAGAERLYGYSAAEVIGRPVSTLLAPENTNELTVILEKIGRGERVEHYETERVRKDGVRMPVAVSVSPIRDAEGHIIGASSIARDVTERKRAEEALRRAGTYNRSLIEASLDPLVTIAPDGKITDVNTGTEKVTGRSRQELIGTDFSDYFTDPERARAGYQQVFRKGSVQDYELELRHRDGHTMPVLYNASLYRGEEGEVVGVFAAARDISDQKRAQKSLRRANAYNRSLIEASLDPLVTIAPDGKITDVNTGTEKVTGRSRQELIGADFSDYFTDPERARAGYQQVFREGSVQDYELEVRHCDGHTTPVLYNASLYRNEKGEVVGVFAAARDITERKRAEAALLESKRRLDLAQKGGRTGVWEWNPASKAIIWTPEAEALFGLPPGGFGHDYAAWRQVVHPDDIARAEESLRAALEGTANYDAEFRVRWPDGSTHWLLGRGEVIRGEAGAPVRMVGVNVDVTERKQAEQEVRDLNANLERRVTERTAELALANQELEAFTYSVAHDLRAPLRAMEGFGAALLEEYGPALDEQAQDYIARIRKASTRMAQLIEDLLNLSRISRAEVRRERVDLSMIATEVVAELRRSSPERGERAQVCIAPSLEAEGDPHLLRAVLENLLGNAWKFSAARDPARIELGTLRAAVDVGAPLVGAVGGHEARPGEPVYFVRDNGAGFDMTYVNKLFAPFQRLHLAVDFPGTGIGLATVARIVRKHGGKVWAEAAVDKGATFYFTLGVEKSRVKS